MAQTSARLDWQTDTVKAAAHRAVSRAVALGLLVAPDVCECGCGEGGPLTPHHDDYSKPLDVRWLRRRCHRQYHFALSKVTA